MKIFNPKAILALVRKSQGKLVEFHFFRIISLVLESLVTDKNILKLPFAPYFVEPLRGTPFLGAYFFYNTKSPTENFPRSG